MLKSKLQLLESILRDGAKTRVEFRAKLADLEARRKEYSADGIKTHIDPQITRINQEYEATMKRRGDMAKEALQAALAAAGQDQAAKNSVLENSKLAAARELINDFGNKLPVEIINDMMEQFVGDRHALQILGLSYEAAGIPWAAEKSKSMIYDPAALQSSIAQKIDHAFGPANGWINPIAAEIAKFAAREGLEFATDIMPGELTEMVFSGAGITRPA